MHNLHRSYSSERTSPKRDIRVVEVITGNSKEVQFHRGDTVVTATPRALQMDLVLKAAADNRDEKWNSAVGSYLQSRLNSQNLNRDHVDVIYDQVLHECQMYAMEHVRTRDLTLRPYEITRTQYVHVYEQRHWEDMVEILKHTDWLVGVQESVGGFLGLFQVRGTHVLLLRPCQSGTDRGPEKD